MFSYHLTLKLVACVLKATMCSPGPLIDNNILTIPSEALSQSLESGQGMEKPLCAKRGNGTRGTA